MAFAHTAFTGSKLTQTTAKGSSSLMTQDPSGPFAHTFAQSVLVLASGPQRQRRARQGVHRVGDGAELWKNKGRTLGHKLD